MKKFFYSLILCVVLLGCKNFVPEFPIVVEDKPGLIWACNTTEQYSYKVRQELTYLRRRVVIQSQVDLDETFIDAQMASEILETVLFAATNRFMHEPEEKHELLKKYLSEVQLIIAVDAEHLDQFWDEKKDKEQKFLAKTQLSKHACFAVESRTWFSTIVAKAFKRDNISVLVHEAMHIVSYTYYGNFDINHENTLLWQSTGGSKSLQFMVKRVWGQ